MSLLPHLIARIHQNGPMPVSDYMAECLLHPEHGYYATRDPLGAQGDFITAPEISQMFGELVGLCVAQSWMDQGQPSRFSLAEFGPGRGTLMADILRATRGVPGFHDAAQVVLLEASPTLKAIQAETLANHAPKWITSAADLADQPLFLVANEFFDALPIRQFTRDAEGWCERLIGAQEGDLTFGLGTRSAQPALKDRLTDTKDGDMVELCPSAAPILSEIARRIATKGGAGLIIDYGDWRSLGDTLQALQAHHPVDLLKHPGQADLTAHVDFEALAETARASGCSFSRLTPQGVFLERLGITARAQALAAHHSGEARTNVITAHRRLTHPQEMGNLFKILGLYPPQAAPPPGLES